MNRPQAPAGREPGPFTVLLDFSAAAPAAEPKIWTADESLLAIPEDDRPMSLPVARPSIDKLFQQALNSLWTPKVISSGQDRKSYDSLAPEVRGVVNHIMGFFAVADNIINANIVERFLAEIKIPEARKFLYQQLLIESVHADVYAEQVLSLIPDVAEQWAIQRAHLKYPSIDRVLAFIRETVSSSASFSTRLCRAAASEGLLFRGCFVFLYWLDEQGLMPEMCKANKYIAADESLHARFAAAMNRLCRDATRASQQTVHGIFAECVELGTTFIAEAMPQPLYASKGGLITVDSMNRYLKSQANMLVEMLGYSAPYPDVENPFEFMRRQAMVNHAQFFEVDVTDYRQKDAEDSYDLGDF